jgi:hypothetical protein
MIENYDILKEFSFFLKDFSSDNIFTWKILLEFQGHIDIEKIKYCKW